MEEKHMQVQAGQYLRFALMVALSFVAMYGFMYSMINNASNFYPNLNQFYMAGLMTVPMVILEMLLMGMMYERKQWNMIIIALAIIGLVVFWVGIRRQVAIGDTQFLKSMIPHHAGAILMCEEAKVQDPRIKQLCVEIISSQRAEVAQMKSLLAERRH